MLLGDRWRHLLMAVAVFGSLALMLSQQRIGQDPAYHGFADRRAFFGIPNFFDVAPNLAFLVVGALGLRICLSDRIGRCRNAWLVLFAGVTLVAFGSAYFHWDPNDQTLVWDRLPMTVGFMGLFAALVGEHIGDRFARFLLAPALLLGVASVVYWHWSGDLRFYYWVQLTSLLTIPVVLVLYRARYSHRWLLLAALGCYALAKVAEANDGAVFDFTRGPVSGHTLKHLLSALGCLTVAFMLDRRKLIEW